MPTHQLGKSSLAVPGLIGSEQGTVAGGSQSAHFLGQSQMTQEEAESACTHGNQAPNRVSLGISPANSVRLDYFAKNPKRAYLRWTWSGVANGWG
jgi:hypothetical protein